MSKNRNGIPQLQPGDLFYTPAVEAQLKSEGVSEPIIKASEQWMNQIAEANGGTAEILVLSPNKEPEVRTVEFEPREPTQFIWNGQPFSVRAYIQETVTLFEELQRFEARNPTWAKQQSSATRRRDMMFALGRHIRSAPPLAIAKLFYRLWRGTPLG